ncbi:MAG: pyruvate kinase [Candidatus Omnitrophica bacterium]|nr:pyruvate kinase [Candidatus Omnitrophota bacterium]MBU4589410.1 pyruvate kinase [Candidatus Omnitrophota bacterium]
MVRTKIICTLGPASSNETVVRNMMLQGMDVVRLNFSHGNHAAHLSRINLLRKVNERYRRRVRILQDLEGPRVRIGRLKGHRSVVLKKMQAVWLSQKDIHETDNVIPFDYEGPLASLKGAEFIYIDDGNIVLKVKGIEKRKIRTEVVIGGVLKEHKGINVPGARLQFPKIGEKDKKDIVFGIEAGVDYIAQSFVRNKKDIMEVKKRVKPELESCLIISKIENREGIRNIDEIIDSSDGIMIARGDMGVSVPVYEVPIIQKRIIKKCNKKKKFVITATQMLEGMVENIRPTRAEVTDVANAIIDGTDFVMLSAETAVGRYPVESVKMMNDIIKFTEKHK